MAIYRGEGGAGDATADASNAAALADSFADAANASAGQAATSASAALAAQTAAELAETNAETAETNAEAAEAAAVIAKDAAEAVLLDTGFSVVASDLQGDDNIGTVADDIVNVNAVANNIDAVIAVDANEANINIVAADGTDIGTVATSIADVNSVADNIADVTAVADNETNIDAVAANNTNITTVAGISANVTTVAGISANVTTVATNDTNVTTVATNIANVNSVGTNIANVNSVAGNETNIDAVAANETNIDTVAGISGNVTTVATNNANVTTVATNIANVNNVGNNIANVNQVAADTVVINSASANATAAASSATAAAGSATSASASAAAASAVALGNEPVRHSVRPSLLLDFANTKTLDPRITFTRASTGTFYDGKTVAKAEENLLLQSQSFATTSAWTATANNTVVTANTAVAPDGTTTASTITENTATSYHAVQSANIVVNSATTVSAFLKTNTAQFAYLAFWDGSTYVTAVADLTNGTITSTSGTPSATSITSVGNSWYRVTVTKTINTTTGVQIGLSDSGTPTFSTGRPSYTGDGARSIFAWGAQLEQRSSVTAYTATTTAPITNYIPALQTAASGVARFEHNPITGESLGLEIEEQRTNVFVRSEEFQTTWANTGVSVTTNTIVSPDGNLTGDKVVESTATSAHQVTQNITATSGVTYTATLYAKKAEIDVITTDFAGVLLGTYNLSTGVATLGAGSANTTAVSVSMVNVGNGWYRCVSVWTRAGATATSDFRFSLRQSTSYTGDGYSGIYIWGAQLEAGAFATSYIPTTTAQVTRSADLASMTGTNFSSWYRADEGTLYVEWNEYLAGTQGSATSPFAIADASSTVTAGGKMYFYSFQAGNKIRYQLIRVNGTVESNVTSGTAVANNVFGKSAMAYKVNDIAFSSNGATVATDTLSSIPVVDRAFIGSVVSTGAFLNGNIKKIAYYPLRISNAEIQGLTTV
jgi:hypothetical protein